MKKTTLAYIALASLPLVSGFFLLLQRGLLLLVGHIDGQQLQTISQIITLLMGILSAGAIGYTIWGGIFLFRRRRQKRTWGRVSAEQDDIQVLFSDPEIVALTKSSSPVAKIDCMRGRWCAMLKAGVSVVGRNIHYIAIFSLVLSLLFIIMPMAQESLLSIDMNNFMSLSIQEQIQYTNQLSFSNVFAMMGLLAVTLLVFFFNYGFLLMISWMQMRYRRRSWSTLWKHKRHLLTATGVMVFRGFLVMLGLMLFIIPGVWLFVRRQFAPLFSLLTGKESRTSLSMSAYLVKGKWWEMLGYGLLPLFLTAIVLFGATVVVLFFILFYSFGQKQPDSIWWLSFLLVFVINCCMLFMMGCRGKVMMEVMRDR